MARKRSPPDPARICVLRSMPPFRALIAAALAVSLVIFVPVALAADPSSGKVSRSAPKTAWKGQITGFAAWQTYNQGAGQCVSPSCETFTLEVADGGGDLNIAVTSA